VRLIAALAADRPSSSALMPVLVAATNHSMARLKLGSTVERKAIRVDQYPQPIQLESRLIPRISDISNAESKILLSTS